VLQLRAQVRHGRVPQVRRGRATLRSVARGSGASCGSTTFATSASVRRDAGTRRLARAFIIQVVLPPEARQARGCAVSRRRSSAQHSCDTPAPSAIRAAALLLLDAAACAPKPAYALQTCAVVVAAARVAADAVVARAAAPCPRGGSAPVRALPSLPAVTVVTRDPHMTPRRKKRTARQMRVRVGQLGGTVEAALMTPSRGGGAFCCCQLAPPATCLLADGLLVRTRSVALHNSRQAPVAAAPLTAPPARPPRRLC
jgi:hypothetical protein